MSKIILDPDCLNRLGELDIAILQLNNEKIRLLFEMLPIDFVAIDLERILGWDLILISVPDRQMAVQLNKLSAYIPNLKFVVDAAQPLFTILPGKKPRRVWKER